MFHGGFFSVILPFNFCFGGGVGVVIKPIIINFFFSFNIYTSSYLPLLSSRLVGEVPVVDCKEKKEKIKWYTHISAMHM